jgi:hypothetical protein
MILEFDNTLNESTLSHSTPAPNHKYAVDDHIFQLVIVENCVILLTPLINLIFYKTTKSHSEKQTYRWMETCLFMNNVKHFIGYFRQVMVTLTLDPTTSSLELIKCMRM